MDSEKNTPQPEGGQEKPEGFDMKKIDTLTVKDIRTMPEQEFLSLLKKSFDEAKDVILNKVEMNHLALQMARPRFEKLQKYIKYDKKQTNHFEVTVPVIDEKQLEANKKDAAKFKVDLQEYHSLPDTDCYIRCGSKPLQNSLGLLTIENRGYFIPRKFNEHKHEDIRLEYSKESFFYFDYEKKLYVQAFEQDVIDLRRLDKLDKEIDESKYEPHSLLFWKREKLLNEIEDRLKEISEEKGFRKKFIKFTMLKSPTPRSIDGIKKYAASYYMFLECLDDWLQIKLFLGKISPLVYETLQEEIGDLIVICIDILTKSEYVDDDIEKLESFQEGKPEDDKLQAHNLMQGFVKYISKNRILVPNIVEIERSRSIRLNDHYNNVKYEEYLERVMRLLDKKESQKEQK